MKKVCKIHGLFEFKERLDGSSRCRQCLIDAVSRRRRKLKLLAVDYKGGKCSVCGYKKCVDALEFHHLDPSKKDFGIGSGITKAWSKIKKELDKCELLCSNCHKELHSIPL